MNSTCIETQHAIEVIERRHSVLRYLPKPVESEKIDLVLETAVAAPSPLNLQPWAFVVVTDPDLTNRVARYLIRIQAEVVYGGLMGMAPDFTARMLTLYEHLDQAPCFILACLEAKTRFTPPDFEPILRDFYLLSIGAAMQNLMIAATELGLGTRWFSGFTLADEGQTLKDTFRIPSEVEVVAITPLGYHDEAAKQRPEQQLADLVEFQPGNGPSLARLFRGKLPLSEVIHDNRW